MMSLFAEIGSIRFLPKTVDYSIVKFFRFWPKTMDYNKAF